MCHLILLLPVLGLAVFGFLPLSAALPAYAVILAISLVFYYFIMLAMHRPVVTGAEEIRRTTGTVLEVRGRKLLVRVRGEIWSAESPERLRIGDIVRITGLDGLVLRVQPIGDSTHADAKSAVSR